MNSDLTTKSVSIVYHSNLLLLPVGNHAYLVIAFQRKLRNKIQNNSVLCYATFITAYNYLSISVSVTRFNLHGNEFSFQKGFLRDFASAKLCIIWSLDAGFKLRLLRYTLNLIYATMFATFGFDWWLTYSIKKHMLARRPHRAGARRRLPPLPPVVTLCIGHLTELNKCHWKLLLDRRPDIDRDNYSSRPAPENWLHPTRIWKPNYLNHKNKH
jgi:hypothetical protein